jgi:hypothetical protein
MDPKKLIWANRNVWNPELAMNDRLAPSPEEQTFLILQGKCPHNQGWRYVGHSHNDDAYECVACGKLEYD